MKLFLLAPILALASFARGDLPPLQKLREVPFTQVRFTDSFWAPRQKTNRAVSIPHALDMLEQAGDLNNFDVAAKGARTGHRGFVFQDSDVYKVLESASFALATAPDPELEKRVDSIIARIAAAQRPDGYLDTFYEITAPDRRFTNLRDNHELYCAGHLFEAAAAHFGATGKKTLLDIATKYADLICNTFGDSPGQRMGYPGHPEIEQALVKLWKATGNRRYFDEARFFVTHRGEHFFAREHRTPEDRYDGTYWLDDVPIRQHTEIKGHAVRAAYLMSGVVDVARETDDVELLKMVDRVWKNTANKRMFVTGGIGPSGSNEGFTTDYDLPNLTAYQETCASVAMIMWNHRLNLLYGDAKYADLVEQALYNGMLAGVSLDGRRFYYVNPLASTGTHHRQGWFDCACCPPNVTRTLAALGNYAYATGPDSLWVNLYAQGTEKAKVGDTEVGLDVTTDYPWDGAVKLTVRPAEAKRFELRLRVPGWCRDYKLSVNGQTVVGASRERGYVTLDRTWNPGDRVQLDLSMPVRRIEANPLVKDDVGQLAIARGPLVYCFEGMDQKADLNTVGVPPESRFRPVREAGLLGGVTVLKGEGVTAGETLWPGGLYRDVPEPKPVELTAVPYYAWDNRTACPMRVWMPASPPTPSVFGLAKQAKVSMSFISGNCQPWGINDGIEPKSSGEQPAALCHWWPHKGGTQWVQYTWRKPIPLTRASVYWFDDTGRGECRLPVAWRLMYLDGKDWKPVALKTAACPIKLDSWCTIDFAPVSTTALRLEVDMRPGWAAGIHEWKVEGADSEE